MQLPPDEELDALEVREEEANQRMTDAVQRAGMEGDFSGLDGAIRERVDAGFDLQMARARVEAEGVYEQMRAMCNERITAMRAAAQRMVTIANATRKSAGLQ